MHTRTRCEIILIAVKGSDLHLQEGRVFSTDKAKGWLEKKCGMSLERLALKIEGGVLNSESEPGASHGFLLCSLD